MEKKKKEVRKMFTTKLPASLIKRAKMDAIAKDKEMQDWTEMAFEEQLKKAVGK